MPSRAPPSGAAGCRPSHGDAQARDFRQFPFGCFLLDRTKNEKNRSCRRPRKPGRLRRRAAHVSGVRCGQRYQNLISVRHARNLAGRAAKDGAAKKPERVVAISDLPRTVSKLYEQRAAYQNQADRAQKALYQTGDGVMVGAVVGAVGGIVSNVATAASGAGIATVSGLMGSRYDLAAQRNIYNDGARKVSCIITTATGFAGQAELLGVAADGTDPRSRDVANAAQQGADDVLFLVRSQLGQLSPPPINPAAVIALYKGLLAVPDAKGIMETQALSAEEKQSRLDVLVNNAKVDIKACVASGEQVSPKK